jgi:hypothetical protein
MKVVNAVLNALLKLDEFLERFWSLVLSLLCAISGRSNFFFVRVATLGSVGLLEACLLFRALGHPKVSEFVLAGIIGAELGGFCVYLLWNMRHLEKKIGAEGATLPFAFSGISFG